MEILDVVHLRIGLTNFLHIIVVVTLFELIGQAVVM